MQQPDIINMTPHHCLQARFTTKCNCNTASNYRQHLTKVTCDITKLINQIRSATSQCDKEYIRIFTSPHLERGGRCLKQCIVDEAIY